MNPKLRKMFMKWLDGELENITELDAYALSMEIEKVVYQFMKTWYDENYQLPGRPY